MSTCRMWDIKKYECLGTCCNCDEIEKQNKQVQLSSYKEIKPPVRAQK